MYGSERGGGHNKTHGMVEKHLQLDSFNLLHDWPIGHGGNLKWGSGSEASAIRQDEQFTIGYACKVDGEQQEVVQHIALSSIRNGYGGNPRTFFLCPFCNRRVRKLYHRWGKFRCRTCAKLNYRSQQSAHSVGAYARRMEKVLRKDFSVDTGELSWNDMCCWTPSKPPWMRWATYHQKLRRLEHAQETYDEAYYERIKKIAGWIG